MNKLHYMQYCLVRLDSFSGGTNYTVVGTNLNSVVEPRLIFYTTTGSQQRRKRQIGGQIQQILSEVG